VTGPWARHFAVAIAGDAQRRGAVRELRVEHPYLPGIEEVASMMSLRPRAPLRASVP